MNIRIISTCMVLSICLSLANPHYLSSMHQPNKPREIFKRPRSEHIEEDNRAIQMIPAQKPSRIKQMIHAWNALSDHLIDNHAGC